MNLWEILQLPSTWVILAALVIILLYRKMTENFDYFVKQGIPGPKPIPLFGNMWGIWRDVILDYDMRLVNKYGKTFGYFSGTDPNLFTIDPDIIKNVLVKDFDHFVNRRVFDLDTYVFRKFVSILHDQEWKDVRSSVSPTFTTGKIKRMSPLIKACAEDISAKLERTVKETGGKFPVKKFFSSFTMDVIARCAFGMKIENLGEEGDPFMKNAALVFNPPTNQNLIVTLPFILRKFSNFFASKVFVTKEFSFFVDALESLVKSREHSDQKFHDFVEIATEALAESVRTDASGNTVPMWNKEEATEVVIAQSVLFLLAGFDTTGTTLTNIFFLLAKHPEIQERLYNEICEKLEQTGGEVTHEIVNSIPYAEQVINEALRLLPPAARVVERECSKDVRYGNVLIKKGTVVTIPTYALHHWEEYYPDPERFDPERWSPENKAKINPYTFLPFGTGPRNCVGMRFALEEIRFALCTILKKFRFFNVDETPDQIPIDEGFVFVVQLKEFKLGVELR